jgi:hypothetical protein
MAAALRVPVAARLPVGAGLAANGARGAGRTTMKI